MILKLNHFWIRKNLIQIKKNDLKKRTLRLIYGLFKYPASSFIQSLARPLRLKQN